MTKHSNFDEIRFLLHGNDEQYNSDEMLYIATENTAVWGEIAKTVIDSWRIIPSELGEDLSPQDRKNINIQEISPKEIVSELASHPNEIEKIRSINLSPDKRNEVLSEVVKQGNRELWRNLPLHETICGGYGGLVSITDSTYLENSKFSLDQSLIGLVLLVKGESPEGWILRWNPEIAIAIALNHDHPERFAEMLIELLPQASDELRTRLRTQRWLPLASGNTIAPENVINLPVQQVSRTLESSLENAFRIENSDKVCLSTMLPPEYHNSRSLRSRSLGDICSQWYENNILAFLLDTPNPSVHCQFILETLRCLTDRHQAISRGNLEEGLQRRQWLLDRDGRPISPEQVICLPSLSLEVSEILSQIEPLDYVTPQLLRNSIDVCLSEPNLQGLFVHGESALEQLGVALGILPEYYLGNLSLEDLDFSVFLNTFNEFNGFPVLRLESRILMEDFQEYILPEVLRPISDSRLLEVLQWIVSSYPNNPSNDVIEIYNKYLKLASNDLSFSENILPRIQLINQAGNWESVTNLCDGEEFTGIVSKSVLNDNQRSILSSYLNSRDSTTPQGVSNPFPNTNSSSSERIYNNYEILDRYFRPWLPYVPSELIGTFLCLLAGSDIATQGLAQDYLQKRGFDSMSELLVFSSEVRERTFHIRTQPNDQLTQQVINLIGGEFTTQRVSNENLDHIFVGKLSPDTTDITILEISLHDTSIVSVLPDLLFRSATKFSAITGSCQSLEEIWQNASKSKQLDVEVTRDFILKNLRPILDSLGVKNTNPEIKNKLREWDDLDFKLSEQERLSPQVRRRNACDEIRRQIHQVMEDINDLIKNNPDVKNAVLGSIRHKIGHGHYGYDVSSIPFELFQNADDALSELIEMIGIHLLDEKKRLFILEYNENRSSLTIMHWGRPINIFTHPDAIRIDFRRDRSFDRDLVKMLSFNTSDKSEGKTGKFGLGFKSVYLISREPKVISGDLSFIIETGLLPVALPRLNSAEDDYALVESLKRKLKDVIPDHSNRDGLGGTLIDLEIDPEVNVSIQQVITEFEQSIGLLLVFAKSIKSCRLTNVSNQTISWQYNNLLGIQGIEIGSIRILQGDWHTYRLICFRIDDAAIAIVVPNDLSDKASPLKEFPTIWVTAPTKERLGLRFIINGMFDITTGRTSLDRNSERNLELAAQIGRGLGRKLNELFDSAKGNWNRLQQDLGIEHGNEYTFWEFLWNVLGIDWLSKNLDQSAIEILRFIFSGQEYGMGYLINHAAALPNGLYHKYQCLVSPDKVRFIVDGILAKQEYFNQVATWQSFQQNCQPHHVVHKNVWQEVNKLHGNNTAQLTNLTFALALEWELDNKEINHIKARNLGEIVTSEFLRLTTIRSEYDRIKPILEGVCFQSENNRTYVLAAHLLVRLANNAEERLLAAFAPSNLLLHSDYIDSSLDFFLVCREQRETVAVEDMVAWAKAADSDEKRAVREYLGLGERKLVFANALRNSIVGTWMEQDEGVAQILKVSSQQARVEQAIRGEITWDNVGDDSTDEEEIGDDSNESEEETILNPDDILRGICTWWAESNTFEILNYNVRLYPIEIEQFKQKLRSADRSAWMMLFFLGLAHRMGRTTHESHRDFLKFCLDNDWWQVFSNPNPRDFHHEWMNVLDKYMELQVDRTKWNYWMEKFPAIYRTAKYLDDYIHSFTTVNTINHSFDLLSITAPRGSSINQGGGIDVPPLPLGIGGNFVLRELVRLGIVESTEYILPHCFVPRAIIRRAMQFLGCQNINNPDYQHSREIYRFLQDKLNSLYEENDPTFQKCFDIPFEIYSRNLNLSRIKVRDDIGWYEDIAEEEHRQYETTDLIISSSGGDFVTLSDGRVIPRS